jgi:hypothetical protein
LAVDTGVAGDRETFVDEKEKREEGDGRKREGRQLI